MDKKTVGKIGEDYAAKYLSDKGYTILERNYHSRYGEIDIIGDNGEYLVFVEVKTLIANSGYLPREAVNATKQEKIIKTAEIYFMAYAGDSQPRFDVCEILLGRGKLAEVQSCEYLESAFELH